MGVAEWGLSRLTGLWWSLLWLVFSRTNGFRSRSLLCLWLGCFGSSWASGDLQFVKFRCCCYDVRHRTECCIEAILLSLYRHDGKEKDCLIVLLKSECLCSCSYFSALQRTWWLSSLNISTKSRDSCFLNILNSILPLLCHEWSSLASVLSSLSQVINTGLSSQYPSIVHSYRHGLIGIPLHSVNLAFAMVRIYWCGSKLKVPAKEPTLKMVRVGSWMTSKGWSVSSALMIRQSKIHGSLSEPFAGENLTILFRSRVGAYWEMAPLRSGKGCKPQVGGDAFPQYVE